MREGTVATEASLLVLALDWQSHFPAGWPQGGSFPRSCGAVGHVLSSGRVVDYRVTKGTSRCHRL